MNATVTTRPGLAVSLLCLLLMSSGCDSSTPADESMEAAVTAPEPESDTSPVKPPFDPANFQPDGDDVGKWDWPSMPEFEENWDRALESLVVPGLVTGDIHYEPHDTHRPASGRNGCDFPNETVEISDLLLEFESDGDKTHFRSLVEIEEAQNNSIDESMEAVNPLDEDLSTARYESDCGELTIKPDYVALPGSPNERELVAYVYAETLLGFDDDIYDEYETPEEVLKCHRQSGAHRGAASWRNLADRDDNCYQMIYDDADSEKVIDGRDIDERRRAEEERIERLFALNIPGDNRIWGTALRRAQQWNDPELEYRISRRYRPGNDCGADTTAQRATVAYENLCARLEKTGCFLNLRDKSFYISPEVREIRDYKTLKEAQTPVDAELFWRGRSLRFTGGDQLRPSILARIAADSEPWLLDLLVEMSQDTELDDSSRLHAATALHAAESSESLNDLELSPAAQIWWTDQVR